MHHRLNATVVSCVALALFAGCTAHTDAPDQKAPQAAGRKISIQAHRGGGSILPENTLPTFEQTWKWGLTPESDVRNTKDGVIVTFHDNNFKRLVKDASPEVAKKGVGDLTWAELSKLDVGAYLGPKFAGQHIPKLDDVFAAMQGHPERMLYLDVKKISFEQMADMVRRHGVEKQVILASTKDEEVRKWMELLPQSHTLLWMGGTQEVLTARLDKLRAEGFPGVTSLQIHVHIKDLSAAEPFDLPNAFLRKVGEELRQRGIEYQVFPWETGDPVAFHRLLDLGVVSFATDQPLAAMKAVETYKPRQGA